MGYSNMSSEQNELIDLIDSKLTIVLNSMEYKDYLEFLQSNEYLRTYDDVLGYVEVDYLPDAFCSGLTIDFLNKVLNVVNSKIEELGLE